MSDSSDSPPEKLGSVLLSAGRGTRIRPLSDVCPKAALPLLDVPQARPALRILAERAPSVAINLGHLAEEGARRLGVDVIKGIETLVEKPEPFGTGGTLRALLPRLGPTVVTWNADLLTDLDPTHLLETHRRLGAPATLAVTKVSRAADFAQDGRLLTQLLDRRRGETGAGARFIGMAVFERTVLKRLSDKRPLGLTEGLLSQLAEENSLACHLHDGYARDVGNLRDYLEASTDLLNEKLRIEYFDPPGHIVEVNGGRAYIGTGAEVDESSLGRNAIVLAGATIDPAAFVTDAVVWPNERVPARVRVSNGVWFKEKLADSAGGGVSRRENPPPAR